MPEELPIERRYTNGEITVLWLPALCTHCEFCHKGKQDDAGDVEFSGLPQVFNPAARPWVNMRGATTERIVDQVNHCPSGALSIV